MIKLSRVGKLDGIQSWSLEAVRTCPGAHAPDGNLVPVCQGCYARGGNYRFPNVSNVRRHNRVDWQRDRWVSDMTSALEDSRYFRWFDSGDIYHPLLAEKIHAVISNTPWCRHWIPTRSHKIERIRRVLERIAALPNAVVRYSADEIDQFDPDLHGSAVITDPERTDLFVCRASQRTPKRCNGCRACWDKSVPTIGYLASGVRMRRLLAA